MTLVRITLNKMAFKLYNTQQKISQPNVPQQNDTCWNYIQQDGTRVNDNQQNEIEQLDPQKNDTRPNDASQNDTFENSMKTDGEMKDETHSGECHLATCHGALNITTKGLNTQFVR